MQYLYLSAAPRQISVCQRHDQREFIHPDRIMTEHDLFYVVRGQWEVWQGEACYTLSQGDALLLAAGAHHYGRTRSSSDCETIYIHFSVHPDDRLMNTAEQSPSPEAFVLPVCSRYASATPVYGLFSRVVESYWSKDIYAAFQAEAYLSVLLAEMTKARWTNQLAAEKEVQVDKILLMLDINSERFYAAEELAEAIGVSSRTLQKYFQDVLGMPVHRYQLQHKLARAREMLLQAPEIPLAEVAERLGFCDEYHFSKQYKKQYGVSPKRMK